MSDDKTTKKAMDETVNPEQPANAQKSESKSRKAEDKVQTSTKTSADKKDKKKSEDKKEKKKAIKKPSLTQKEIDKLILENADLKAENKENKDKFLLIAAEFENFKKRTNKDQLRSRELYKESMLAGLLPVLDDIDRGLQHHKGDETEEALNMTKTKLLAYLENYEIKAFDSVGQEFDPDKHDAMLTRTEEDKDNNTVLEEFEKGYVIGKKVLRHAKVIVNIIE